ncbi:unnamed protein product [Owenia fusiformis]|uniref:Uncharacterized protein n=1 Tax=Owenia fusiformis TaxID=6347 RepID=A0A8J1TWV7_OWEFU|nr:unnamed protein product [Owenia fusiformis]
MATTRDQPGVKRRPRSDIITARRPPSYDTYMVRIYTGNLSNEIEYVSIESNKEQYAIDIVSAAAAKLHMSNTEDDLELAEVFFSVGQLCKERRIGASEYPVKIQKLWPKVSHEVMQDRSNPHVTEYRFYLRQKEKVRTSSSINTWVEYLDPSPIDNFMSTFLVQPQTKEYQDLCNLPDLNERTLMDNLRARFQNGNIYTYVGSILIAMNPFKFYPIYNPKYVKMYQNKRLGELHPHIFAIADAAFYNMVHQRRDQCIVISGESGSGKTESTNLLLHHLTALSQKGLHGSGVEHTILGAGPVLEAFGNAKTVYNNNSSRFGKFIQVNYRENGMVHGAIVDQYLLEKSRIVSQAKDERNYHVFYYLLAGASESEKETLSLTKPEDYHYLNQNDCYTLENIDGENMDEAHEFARLKQSMEMVGFSTDIQRRLFAVLAAVLHLGNVEYKKKSERSAHHESVEIKNMYLVTIISNLLRVKDETLVEALTKKKTQAGGETVLINYKMEEAIATRDGMAKCLYGALFDWIVLQVNHALVCKKDNRDHQGNSIGVLDIFGFEDFERNSFEQFCINYANEHLQYYFNQHIFKFEQEEYMREGIQWKNIEFIDNTGCLDLFAKKPAGLFSLLDEECNFPGATNETLLQKFHSQHRNTPYYEAPRTTHTVFSVVHYAGKVQYGIRDFREKNLDLMRQDVVFVLKNSTQSFVRELVGADPLAVLRWAILRAFFRGVAAFKMAGKRYRKQGGRIGSIRRKAQQNSLKAQSTSSLPVRQLSMGPKSTSTSSMDSIQTMGLGGMFETTLALTVLRRIKKNKSFKPKSSRSLKGFRDLKSMRAMQGKGAISRRSSSKKMPSVSAQFQHSLSKLMETLDKGNPYFIRCIKSNADKAPCRFDDETVLRQLRYTGMLATVMIRQSGYNYRLTFEEFIFNYKILLPNGLLSSREDVTKFLNSLGLNKDNYQIGKTKVFLRETEKLRLDDMLHQAIMACIIKIQRLVRAKQERQRYIKMRSSVIKIQAVVRSYIARRRIRLGIYAAMLIQKYYKGYKVRKAFREKVQAAVQIQSAIRFYLAQKRYQSLLEERRLRLLAEEEEKERQLQAEHMRKMIEERRLKELREAEIKKKLEEQKKQEELAKAQRQKELNDILNLSTSDEGILTNKDSSSTEELDYDHPKSHLYDSEESSGILDDHSETELDQSLHRKSRDSIVSPPTTLSHAAKQHDTLPRHPVEVVPSLPGDGAVTPDDETDQGQIQRSRSNSRVLQMAQSFERIDETPSSSSQPPPEPPPRRRQILMKSQSADTINKSQPRVIAPLAKQESLADFYSEEYTEDNELNSSFTRQGALTPDKLKEIEKMVNRRRDKLEVEEDGSAAPASSRSPFRRAKKHIKNFMGGKKSKKDIYEQSDESDTEETSNTNTSASILGKSIGVPVLPAKSLSKPTSPTADRRKEQMSPKRLKETWAAEMSHIRSTSSAGNDEDQLEKKPKHRRKGSKKFKGEREPKESQWNVAGTSQWQYPTIILASSVLEFKCLEKFISQKCMSLSEDGGKQDTAFDRVFKATLKEIQSVIITKTSIAMQVIDESLNYRDLMISFENSLRSKMLEEGSSAELEIMGINAFRGFLDEFNRKKENREFKELKKDNRTRNEAKQWKKDKKKKDQIYEHLGHKFSTVQFNIHTYCEVCSSLLWMMEKGYSCQICKFTCHKKCCSKNTSPCSNKRNPADRAEMGVFGVELETLCSEEHVIPVILEKLIAALEVNGIYTEGIYRKSGSAARIKTLIKDINTDMKSVHFEDYSVHLLAGVIKQFFRDLPTPLLTFDLYDEFLRVSELVNPKEVSECVFSVLKKLPKAHYDTLERLMFHLARVAQNEQSNKMSCTGLAIIFAPCILKTSKLLPAQESLNHVPKQTRCVQAIIEGRLSNLESTLEDIKTLETASATASDRLTFVRASIRKSAIKKEGLLKPNGGTDRLPSHSESIAEENEVDQSLMEEEEALSAHMQNLETEKDLLTSNLRALECRLASSDDDMLSGDEIDSPDGGDIYADYTNNFDLPGRIPINKKKGRLPTPIRPRSFRYPPSDDVDLDEVFIDMKEVGGEFAV